jgi:diguanylate cyclase
MSADDDRIEFVADASALPPSLLHETPWIVLIVDDDEDVHQATLLGLQGVQILGRPLHFLHAYTAAQAETLLGAHQDVAVVLLDVVMEDSHAGLSLVHRIRRDLKLANPRIVLRTGQPGYAPEIEAIRDYDINDYKTKGELTRNKLYTALTSAIRAYEQIRQLDESRRGLELIIRASTQFIAEDGLQPFAVGVITQLAALIGVPSEGLVCAQAEGYRVIAAAGRYAGLIQRQLTEIDDERVRRGIARCLDERRSLAEDRAYVLYIPSKSGQHFAAFIDSPQPLREPDRHLLEVFCANIAVCADNVQLVQRLHRMAYQDRLVQLPNRTAFVEAIDAALRRDEAAGLAVALLDIDQFAETNEAFGYAYGDALLRAVAERLSTAFPPPCHVARVSNDTFGLIGQATLLTPERLLDGFHAPFALPEGEHRATASAGVVHLDDPALRAQQGADILENCYVALKHAKAAGHGSHAHYTPAFGLAVRERTRLLQDLRQALAQRELHLVYQPLVDLASGRTVAIEALLRWQHADGRCTSPDRFMPVAEQTGLIGPLGDWALRSALQELARLRQAGHLQLRLAVNVSALQLLQPGFAQEVRRALEEADVPPALLELEITESVAMSDPVHAQAILSQLQSLGVGLAIDDFGTGFSSLAYLERLPVDRLKIDRAFIHERHGAMAEERIAPMIVNLGHALGLKVVAEGVENETQLNWLRSLACDEGQGYWFSPPLAPDDLRRWLAAQAPVAPGQAPGPSM